MIYLIHIGVNGSSPRCSPYGKRSCGELCQRLAVCDDLNVPAALVKKLCRGLEYLIGGVVGEVGACDGEGNLEVGFGVAHTVIVCLTHKVLYVRDGLCLVESDIRIGMTVSLLVVAAAMIVGLYLLPTSFCKTSTGRMPPCSLPTTGLRSA